MDKNINISVADGFSTMRRIEKYILVNISFFNIEEADDGKTALPETGVNGHIVKPSIVDTLRENVDKVFTRLENS